MFKVNIVLRGRVQGVGFRYYAKKCADEMKIAGKIWNNYDGSVEIIGYLESKKDIEEFVEKMKKGPEMSSVKESNVIIIPSAPPIEEVFEIDN
ncbi:acylphosphatase [Brachyspira sp. CAG:700]|nr:acylphosphatase [Brachyspira sp. CAG:700]